jgi:rRNA maturation endonuclease Nob1
MIEKALNTLGKTKCNACNSIVSKDNDYCDQCGAILEEVKTSTPEDGL